MWEVISITVIIGLIIMGIAINTAMKINKEDK